MQTTETTEATENAVTFTDYECELTANVFDHLLRFTDDDGNTQIDLSPDDVAVMHSVIGKVLAAVNAKWDV